jgi:hypothetical protein
VRHVGQQKVFRADDGVWHFVWVAFARQKDSESKAQRMTSPPHELPWKSDSKRIQN